MGKTQSKRSVDITTDAKKAAGEGDEVAGKVEKIEDLDQKEATGTNAAAAVNGDTTPQEKNDAEKKETPEEGSENDKDLTTEKNAEAAAAGDGSGDNAATPNTPDAEQKEGAGAASGAEEISPLTDDSKSKTSSAKKDKVKKKWSFRSISFGKKDKQKPAKSDEATAAAAAAADAAVTNGEADKTEGGGKPDEGVGDANASNVAASDETRPTENGVASEQEAQLNGDKTPSPTTEEQQQPKQNEINEPNTNKATETITIATNATPPPTPAATSNTETAKDTAANVVETVAVAAAAAETNAAPTHVSNGNAAADEVTAAIAANTNADEISSKVSIPSVTNNDIDVIAVEKPQQNGTNGEAEHDAEPKAKAPASNINELAADVEQIKIKSQIEDIANAKDLMENVAAEITTQELTALTCE